MQPESTPLKFDNQLSVELVHMGVQHAQSPQPCDGGSETACHIRLAFNATLLRRCDTVQNELSGVFHTLELLRLMR